MKRRWKIALLIGCLFLVSVAMTYFIKREDFVITNPIRQDLTQAIYGLGKIKSHQKYEVIVGVISTIRDIFVKEGDDVSKGTTLLVLESGTSFKSPIDGRVTYIKFERGETVLPQMTILKVEDLSDRYMEVSLEQEAALFIHSGQEVEVSFENLRGQIFKGKVLSVFPREGEFLSHLEIFNLDPRILPGMMGDVVFKISKIKSALTIPRDCLEKGYVEVLRNKKWKKIKLDLGLIFEKWVEVKSNNVSESDKIRYPRSK